MQTHEPPMRGCSFGAAGAAHDGEGSVFQKLFASLPDSRTLRPKGGGRILVRYLGYYPLQNVLTTCFMALCNLTRQPHASSKGRRWNSRPLPGVLPAAISRSVTRSICFDCLYYTAAFFFCQVLFQNFFGYRAYKRLVCVLPKGENFFASPFRHGKTPKVESAVEL